MLKTNPQAGDVNKVEKLQPWHLGKFEGQPTDKVIKHINDYIVHKPDTPIQGRGPESTQDGESFNQFKNPFLLHVIRQIEDYKPGEKILNVAHYRNIRTLESWVKKGAKDDLSIDTKTMTTKGDSDPSDLFRLDPNTRRITKVEDASKPGIYFARHGSTQWNAENENGKEGGE